MVVLLILNGSGRLNAQTQQSGLNQAELLRQFIGTWKNEEIKDTVYTAELKPYGNNGLEFTLTGFALGKTWLEEKQLWGYDKTSDKIVVAGMTKNVPHVMLQSMWFTTRYRCEQVPLEFASDPEKSNFKVTFDLKSPDLVVREEILNNKSLGTENYKRVEN